MGSVVSRSACEGQVIICPWTLLGEPKFTCLDPQNLLLVESEERSGRKKRRRDSGWVITAVRSKVSFQTRTHRSFAAGRFQPQLNKQNEL